MSTIPFDKIPAPSSFEAIASHSNNSEQSVSGQESFDKHLRKNDNRTSGAKSSVAKSHSTREEQSPDANEPIKNERKTTPESESDDKIEDSTESESLEQKAGASEGSGEDPGLEKELHVVEDLVLSTFEEEQTHSINLLAASEEIPAQTVEDSVDGEIQETEGVALLTIEEVELEEGEVEATYVGESLATPQEDHSGSFQESGASKESELVQVLEQGEAQVVVEEEAAPGSHVTDDGEEPILEELQPGVSKDQTQEVDQDALIGEGSEPSQDDGKQERQLSSLVTEEGESTEKEEHIQGKTLSLDAEKPQGEGGRGDSFPRQTNESRDISEESRGPGATNKLESIKPSEALPDRSVEVGSELETTPDVSSEKETAGDQKSQLSNSLPLQEVDAGSKDRLPRHIIALNGQKPAKGIQVSEADQNRFIQRVARAFQSAQDGDGKLQLRLSPPELGSLRLEVKIENGVMVARLETETASARSILLDNISALRSRLADQGIRIEQFDVDLMDRQASGQPDNTGDQSDRDAHSQSEQGILRSDEAEQDAPNPHNSPSPIEDGGGLNVIV